MITDNSFATTQYLLTKAMTAESKRFSVISNNIANADTPYFKRSEVTFEAELERAISSDRPEPFEAKKTHEKHFSFSEPKDFRKVEPKVHLEYNTSYRNDKNNVDVDKEMVDAAKSTMRFNSFTSIIGRNFRKINMLLRG